ncbi:pituitary tumor-transforming protein 1 protein-interacting protein-like protein [Turdus rufiventris]|nr:pituitary tumor-transforming protein 1 protein-interacting protein-like protein [Turdus rufiventris]
MEAVRRWLLWLQGLALLWGRAVAGLEQILSTVHPAPAQVNFEALIIAMAVVAGLILVSITVCCCYCCYCRRRSRSRLDEEEEQLARKKEERRLQSLQRRHERKLKHDEIRKKYGLLQDSDNPYSRFENE